jgi:hypothetical protein
LEESQPRSYEELRDTVRGDFIAFDEALEFLYEAVEELEIPKLGETLRRAANAAPSRPSGVLYGQGRDRYAEDLHGLPGTI